MPAAPQVGRTCSVKPGWYEPAPTLAAKLTPWSE